MVESRTVVLCAESGAHWYQDYELAKCAVVL